MPQAPPYLGMNLSVRGTKVHHPAPRTRSASKAKKHRESSEEQESYNSGPDSNMKRRNVRVQSSFSKEPKMKDSNGSSRGSRCEDHTDGTITLNKSDINFEGKELSAQLPGKCISQENTVIYSKDSSDEQCLVSSDAEHTVEISSSTNNLQLKDPEPVNNKPDDKLTRNHSSDEIEIFDIKSKTLWKENPNNHSKNGDNSSDSCGNEEKEKNETELNVSHSNSEEQVSPNIAREHVIQTVTLKVSDSHQSLSSSENMSQIQHARIKESKYSSDEGESASSEPELNILERRKIKVNNPQPASTVYGRVTSCSDTTAVKTSLSTSKEREVIKNGLQKTVKRNLKVKKFMDKSAGIGYELTVQKNNNNNVEQTNDSQYEEQAVNSTSEGAFWKKKSIRLKNSKDTSERKKPTRKLSQHKRGRKGSATIGIISDEPEEEQLSDGDTDQHEEKNTSSEINVYHISQEQEIASTGSENKACRNDSITKYARENYEDQGCRKESESPSHNCKNSCTKKSRDRSRTEKQCSRTEQLRNKFKENEEISNFSNTQKKTKKTVKCIGPITINLIEDLTNEMNKAHKSERKRDETAIYATQNHKKTNPSNKTSPGSSTVVHDKVSQMNQQTNMVISEDRMEAEMQGRDVMDVQEREGIFRNATAVMQGKTNDKVTKTEGTSWPNAKHSPRVSHFTEEIYPTVEDVILHGKKHYSSGWEKSNETEMSMEFLNDWKQKLDCTKANCEDTLAKLKTITDNENVINKPNVVSSDKGITWEDGTASKPTISDIIKRLSETRPERELFMCDIRRQVIDTVPEHTLPERKGKIKIQQHDLNMTAEDNMTSAPQYNQRSITPHAYSSSVNWSPVSLAILPHIQHRIKKPSSNNFFCNSHRLENFYAVGMSLKTLQTSHNLKQHLLLPLGSDHCLRVNQLFSTHKRKLPTL